MSPISKYTIQLPNALLQGIRSCLSEIIYNNQYSDKAVAALLKEQKLWGSRDRRIAAGIIYDITRNFLKYSYLRKKAFSEKDSEMDVLIALSLFYEESLQKYLSWTPQFESEITSVVLPDYLKYSLQEWLYDVIRSDWGEQTEIILKFLDKKASVYLRVNTLRANSNKVRQELERTHLEYLFHPEVKHAVEIKSNNQLRRSKAFKEGFFEFQDVSSQFVTLQMGIRPEQTVIDFCAGKGGKTLQIAALMQNTGRLIASDSDLSRLEYLKRRSQRAGLKNLEIISGQELSKYHNIHADMVFIDAPCSGTGTIRRQSDIKFRLQEEDLKKLIQTQQEILAQTVHLIRVGGKLVYATCSILKSENEKQIEKFLQQNSGFKLLKSDYILPEQLNGDGFYLAIMEKISGS